ncbi:terminase small subunit [Larkinella soli]|uniref:terminase small subunit n=1 Tax=Larkinella soli TaxID=1770527 RepID=UPI000FFCAE1D|nr:terminase small subunit [Larkinella soli]
MEEQRNEELAGEELDGAAGQWSDPLTDKQRRFVEEYCVDFNGTQAAIRAGYSDHEPSAATIGWRLLRNAIIKAAIEARLARLTMSTEEAAVRLTRYGRGTLEPFLNDAGLIDLRSEAARRARGLLKKVKQTVRVERNDGEAAAEVISTEIELVDPKDAIDKMLQYHGKYIKKVELAGPDGGAIPLEDVTQLSDEELRRRIGELEARVIPPAAGA